MRFSKGAPVDVYPSTLEPPDNRGTRKRTYPTEPAFTFKAGFAPAGSPEPFEAGRNAVTTQPMLYTPPGVAITAYDQVVRLGKRYEVDGEPDEWDNPESGRRHGMVIRLKRVVG